MSSKNKFTPNDLILVEVCIRQVFCGLINKDSKILQEFCAIIENVRSGTFGYRDLKIEDNEYNLEEAFANLLKKISDIQKNNEYINNACEACECDPCDCNWGS